MIVTPACLCSIKVRTADLNDAFSIAAQFVINFRQTLFGLIRIIFGTLIQLVSFNVNSVATQQPRLVGQSAAEHCTPTLLAADIRSARGNAD
jgi:hypothetical protein